MQSRGQGGWVTPLPPRVSIPAPHQVYTRPSAWRSSRLRSTAGSCSCASTDMSGTPAAPSPMSTSFCWYVSSAARVLPSASVAVPPSSVAGSHTAASSATHIFRDICCPGAAIRYVLALRAQSRCRAHAPADAPGPAARSRALRRLRHQFTRASSRVTSSVEVPVGGAAKSHAFPAGIAIGHSLLIGYNACNTIVLNLVQM
jgi:hypothetical protein